MKKMMNIVVLVLLTGSAFADNYVEAMQEKIQLIYSAQSNVDLQDAINGLDRIAQAEKTKWEPFYYASFGYILMASNETEGSRKDALLDLAQVALNRAKELVKNDSELVTLEGFISTIRLTVDPATRAPKYAGIAMQTLQEALVLNPNNPRATMLIAQLQAGTAAFFNQKSPEGCATAAKALKLFEIDKSENPLAPTWGKKGVMQLLINCN